MTNTSTSRSFLTDHDATRLMNRRIYNVLLVANPYDAFMLEDDGRIEEKIFEEYVRLGLRYPPRFTQVSTLDEAMSALNSMHFELVICMPGIDDRSVFDIATSIKHQFADTPLVVLTPFSHGITSCMSHQDLSIFEYVFCWLGNTDLLISIIKLIEDRMNLDHDIREGGVQMILLVEDSIRFYSSILPNLYKYVFEQMQAFATEALNAHQSTLRMRGRPKIVLARNYEEAMELYSRYSEHTLGVVSDVRFPHGGVQDAHAGLRLLHEMQSIDPYMPLIMQSSEPENRERAQEVGAGFIDKNSKRMHLDLRELLEQYFGFGDLVFHDLDTGAEILRVHNLKELQDHIFDIPERSLLRYIKRNHISRWLCSRAMFPLSEFLKRITIDIEQSVDRHRQIIFDAIVEYRRIKNRGVVAVYQRDRYDRFSNFARIGEGSLGGKGRGVAFMDQALSRTDVFATQFPEVEVCIPKSVVLCTDLFDQFMDDNNLYPIALSDADDAAILNAFLEAKIPESLYPDLQSFCQVVASPIAVRSSSLLEDAHYQPYAGVYSTYMVPDLPDLEARLNLLLKAIKGVYASVFFKASKAYMRATQNVIDNEKMAILLQAVAGRRHGDCFYPTCSGVARSLNYYPVGDEEVAEGTVSLAVGLGKYIVDGGKALRFSPAHPAHVMQTSDLQLALTETQTHFLALSLQAPAAGTFSDDDGFNLVRLPVKVAAADGELHGIASTYVREDQMLVDTVYAEGRKVITFTNILRDDAFPMAALAQQLLILGAEAMRRPVEIEFAVNLDVAHHAGTFYVLQIRPIADWHDTVDVDLMKLAPERLLVRSTAALGNGITTDIHDVIYVPRKFFGLENNAAIAREIHDLNERLRSEGRSYVLLGPGRWGSRDVALGIPVVWGDLSASKLIVEYTMAGRVIAPSQGSHFFQNMTSFGVGYCCVDSEDPRSLALHYLDAAPAALPAGVHVEEETSFLRLLHFDNALTIMLDGKKSEGAVVLDADVSAPLA